jgi:hypothetical protein
MFENYSIAQPKEYITNVTPLCDILTPRYEIDKII